MINLFHLSWNLDFCCCSIETKSCFLFCFFYFELPDYVWPRVSLPRFFSFESLRDPLSSSGASFSLPSRLTISCGSVFSIIIAPAQQSCCSLPVRPDAQLPCFGSRTDLQLSDTFSWLKDSKKIKPETMWKTFLIDQFLISISFTSKDIFVLFIMQIIQSLPLI